MNQDNESTTPSETSWNYVFFVLFLTAPEPGVARQDKKRKKETKTANVRNLYRTQSNWKAT
jgi:hypothetical protein